MRARLRRAPEPLAVRAPPALLDVAREGAAPLAPGGAERARAERLDIAVVVPSFRRGSGGHSTIANLVRGLEARGHAVTLWLEDDDGTFAAHDEARIAALWEEFFGPSRAPLRAGFAAWAPCDVAIATGWQTVHRVLRLPGARARAYLVQDHEPEFYGTSAEATWARETYGLGLHAVCASPWLADLVRERYGASASSFDLGVEHAIYHADGDERREPRVLVYARAVTARRAVPLAALAMEELRRRRPDVEIALFGEARPLAVRFSHRHLGVLPPAELARAYRRAAVGVALSTTNPSLVTTEMLACGLPVVELASAAMVATFGARGPLELAPFDPLAIADAVEALLDEGAEQRAARVEAALALTHERTWERAAAQLEDGLRAALAR